MKHGLALTETRRREPAPGVSPGRSRTPKLAATGSTSGVSAAARGSGHCLNFVQLGPVERESIDLNCRVTLFLIHALANRSRNVLRPNPLTDCIGRGVP